MPASGLLRGAAVVVVFAITGCGGGDGGEENPATPNAEPGRATVVTGTDENFETAVIDESRERPVVVMFTASWSGPDRVLAPTVREAVVARSGRVRLATVDVDSETATAEHYDVMSVPTLMPFVDGKSRRPLVGAVPRARLDRFLDTLERAKR